MNVEVFKTARVLFVKDGCVHCNIYKTFIERYNQKVPLNKQIRVIDCTRLESFGIVENSLVRIFSKYLDSFPTLFFDSRKITGASSREETEAIVRALLENDFIIPEENPHAFTKECKWVKTRFGRKLVCN